MANKDEKKSSSEKRETLPSENAPKEKYRRQDTYDVDIADLHSYRERQDEVTREIENDPGIFEN